MSVLEIETGPVQTQPAAPARRGAPRRPGRGAGRGSAPRLRPARVAPLPGRRPSATACRVEPETTAASRPAPSRPGSWRLTDRGVAVVLVAVAMVTVAALAVLVPTALRVTGDDYRPYGTSQLSAP